MRNLKLSNIVHKQKLCDKETGCKLYVDPLSNDIFTVDTTYISHFKQDGNVFFKWSDGDIVVPKVIAVDALCSTDVLVVVTSQEIVTYDYKCHEEGAVEVVGCVSEGIQAAQWSPDQEILAIVTDDWTVMFLNCEFEPISETALKEADFGTKTFMNVGWGKKETQFHGRTGKQAAQVIKTNVAPSASGSAIRIANITWRGDGMLCAISYVSEEFGNVKFRVFDRQGIVQSTSEDLDYLEEHLCWKPSGNLITSSQAFPNEQKIVFFEKNGLKHGEFVFSHDCLKYDVKGILWNEDSSVLLLWLTLKEDGTSILQLWTVSNYHWYLKQQHSVSNLLDVQWHKTEPLKLFVLTSQCVVSHEYVYEESASFCQSNDNASVAVIDGKQLLVTLFRYMVVPPPISSFKIIFGHTIHQVMFRNSYGERKNNDLMNAFLVHHGNYVTAFAPTDEFPKESIFDCKVQVCSGSSFGVKCPAYKPISVFDLSRQQLKGEIYYMQWVNEGLLACLCTDEGNHHMVVMKLDIGGSLDDLYIIDIEEPVVCVAQCAKSGFIGVQFESGKLGKLRDNRVCPWEENNTILQFGRPCESMAITLIDDVPTAIGRSRFNQLYMGDQLLLSDCNSFLLHDHHLLVTTTAHQLLTVALKRPLNPDAWQQSARNVERKSRLVIAVSNDTKVILQMPRGNLETICPRSLVIHDLQERLDSISYRKAMEIMRRNRIDMNLFYDHNPQLFSTHVLDFVKQVDDPHWIDLFVASLVPESVTVGTYSFAYGNPFEERSDKIYQLCHLVRKAMTEVNKRKYLLPILTTYVRASEIESALKIIEELKSTDVSGFEEGIKHLLYVADVNELCDVALGTYDFDLTIMIYQRSQKDPKEYVPFLNELKSLDTFYQHYTIDVHLKRYTKALESAVHCDESRSNEILQLIHKHKLYKDAIKIFKADSVHYKTILCAYGEHLSARSYNTEAALMYSRAGNWSLSVESYERAGNWHAAIRIATRAKMSSSQLMALCKRLIEMLVNRGEHVQAGRLTESYLHLEEDAIDHYLKGKAWNEALRLVSDFKRDDLIETNIKTALIENHSHILNTIDNESKEYNKFFNRLQTVRDIKYKEYENWIASLDDDTVDVDFYGGDSSTVTGVSLQHSQFSNKTTSSSKTYRSGKNKRKLERKKYSLKEGSTYEDLGLMASIHDIMTNVDKLTMPVYELNCALLTFEYDEKAAHLQATLEKLIDQMKKDQNLIWYLRNDEDEEESMQFGPSFSTNKTISALGGSKSNRQDFFAKRIKELEIQYRLPPILASIPWKLSCL